MTLCPAHVDVPGYIRGLKKYAVDQMCANKVKTPRPNVSTGKRIAVIGAVPSGLTCAYFLALMGHGVDVYDEHEKPGGMLRYGIPEYRLPKERLDEDIEAILRCGDITLHCGTKIGRDVSYEDTSGRVPADMAEKEVAAGVPVLVSKAAATAGAIRLAGEYGLTLLTHAREDSYCLCSFSC